MKKQKEKSLLENPNEDDPVLGSFMKNLQNIAIGTEQSIKIIIY